MKTITFVHSEDHDWVCLYIDGKEAYQGHSINNMELLNCLGIKYESKEVTNEWAENQGHFPKNLKDCEFKK